MSKEKSEGKELQKTLLSNKENAYLKMKSDEIKKCDKFCEGYKAFLDAAKKGSKTLRCAYRFSEA